MAVKTVRSFTLSPDNILWIEEQFKAFKPKRKTRKKPVMVDYPRSCSDFLDRLIEKERLSTQKQQLEEQPFLSVNDMKLIRVLSCDTSLSTGDIALRLGVHRAVFNLKNSNWSKTLRKLIEQGFIVQDGENFRLEKDWYKREPNSIS